MRSVAATFASSNAAMPATRRPSRPRSTGRTWIRSGLRSRAATRGANRIAATIATAARTPGTTETRIAVRTPRSATSAIASSGPPIAPRLSIARSKPYARPYAAGGAMSARSALRDGPRTPRPAHASARRIPTCQAAVAAPISDESTAVPTYPPTAVVRRRSGSSASGPPAKRATPPAPSAIPSITPSAAAARAAPRPSVFERNAGSSAVGTSCPRSESRLAAPIARTPGVSQRSRCGASATPGAYVVCRYACGSASTPTGASTRASLPLDALCAGAATCLVTHQFNDAVADAQAVRLGDAAPGRVVPVAIGRLVRPRPDPFGVHEDLVVLLGEEQEPDDHVADDLVASFGVNPRVVGPADLQRAVPKKDRVVEFRAWHLSTSP